MTVYAIIAPVYNEQLETAVQQQFPDRWYKIAPGQYLVSVERTTSGQIMEKLNVSGGSRGRVLIMRLVNYTGWHAKDMWEWIAAQSPTPPVDPPGDGNG